MNHKLHTLLRLGVFALALILLAGLAHAAFAAVASPSQPAPSDPLWRDVDERILAGGERWIIPQRYRTLAVDLTLLAERLAQAPLEGAPGDWAELTLPLPDGTFGRFQVVESPVMAPELAAQFPEIKTYRAIGIDDLTASARLDRTPAGFHAMILSVNGTVFIDPYRRGDAAHYISYYKRDFLPPPGKTFMEYGPLGEAESARQFADALGVEATSGPELRTYRAAVAATGEYTIFHGGTVGDGLAAVATSVNRVTGVYEREVAVRLVLIANNNLIIYTNPGADPYTNNDGFAMLAENQANLDAVIGDANYDVGHVFSTGGGGVAYLGVPCVTGWKAKGVTGSSSPIGDPFDIDYVAHEMGHQFGANHTFNSIAGACGGGNRNGLTAYEPGSGSTIMSYAGICGADDLQPHSDDYFHTISFDEIIAYTTQGDGNICPMMTNTGNHPPTVEAGVGGFTIPRGTPFMLSGLGSDPDGDPITFNWEEFDLGPAGSPGNPSGNAPIFRSFPSETTPTRVFPKLSEIIDGPPYTIGELLPTYTRTLTFRLTARDNHIQPSAGGVAYDTIAFNVTGSAGPFVVTYPNTPVTWQGYEQRTVTWDVANTNVAPVSCASVDIDLSTDGGYTYPTAIVSGAPNDGSQAITVPNLPTTAARMRIFCATNIFFDISDDDFTIVPGQPPADLSVDKTVSPAGDLVAGEALTYTVIVTNSGTTTATATVTDTFPLGMVDPVCNGTPGDLQDTVEILGGEAAIYTCTASVDPTLSVAITKTADRPLIAPGEAVTYTIEVANPNLGITLTDVTVADPAISGCQPNLGAPIALGPGASQVYVCGGVVLTQTQVNTATVSAQAIITNTASASAPEDPQGPVSGMVSSRVQLTAQSSVMVQVSDLSIAKSIMPGGDLAAGDLLTYTVTITNSGETTATATVTDTFPAGVVDPVCDGAPGDLQASVDIAAGAAVSYTCGAAVDSTLGVAITKTVDQLSVRSGEAVTYTIEVANPNASLTLTNVLVEDAALPGCLPAAPITLGPGESQVYVCPGVVLTQTQVNTATVSAEVLLTNVAVAWGIQGQVASNAVISRVALADHSATTVRVGYSIYLPLILRDEPAPRPTGRLPERLAHKPV